MDFLFGYDEKKIKPYLKMAVQRLQIATNKKASATKHQKREIAKLLEDGKEEKARIKVEHIIREDFVIEGYEVLALLCELLHERIRLISSCKECPPDLFQTVCSLIWAEKNVAIDEFGEVRKQLIKKFGKEFGEAAEANTNNCVSSRLYDKLVYRAPSKELVLRYLDAIAEGYNVDWKSENSVLAQEETMPDGTFMTPTGFSIPMAPGTGLSGAYGDKPTSNVPMTPAERDEREQFLRNQLNAEQREGMSNLSGVPSHYNPGPLIGNAYQAAPPGPACLPSPHPPSASVHSKSTDRGNDGDNGGGGYYSAPPPQSSIPVAEARLVEDDFSGSYTNSKNEDAGAPSSSSPSPSAPASAPAPAPINSLSALEARMAALRGPN